MKSYQKAAVFIAVLLFSVSMISAAIDILGNISDIDLDTEQQDKNTAAEPSEAVEGKRGKGELVKVDAPPTGGVHPLFEIHMPPRTKYLRRTVGEVYEDGSWWPPEDPVVVPYNGEALELNVSGYSSFEPVSFSVKPLIKMRGFVPVTLSVYHIEFNGTLDRYPSMEVFSSPKPFPPTYGVSYANYTFSEARLHSAEPLYLSDCLGVPEEFSDRLKDLASVIVEDAPTAWDKLKAIESYLKERYDFDKGFTPAPPDVDPVEWFLFNEGRGVCTHFNSAFVLLARSINLPARIVNGYLVSADEEFQIVMPHQAHVYAEVPFVDLGWIIFEATPEITEEKPQKVTRIPTITNITDNDEVGIKGGHFKVYGTVTMLNGTPVDGLSVEVYLTVWKNDTGVLCGLGEVREGLFNITCEAAADLEVGDYMLVAHTLGNAVYEDSWSDPPIRIIAETEVTIDAPSSAYVGKDITLKGRLIDKSNSQPIANMPIVLAIDNETVKLTTDDEGMVSTVYSFDAEGNKTITLDLEDTDYYLGSNCAVGVAVKAPPPPKPGLFYILTTFPYNLILAGACAVSAGAVVLLMRRRQEPPSAVEEEETEMEPVEEDLSFESYKEGIVKLFNRFYAFTQRRYGEVEESMTPREFQQAILGKIPEKGACALEDLVTIFEIANYSLSRPTMEDYERCLAAVEMLMGLMEHG